MASPNLAELPVGPCIITRYVGPTNHRPGRIIAEHARDAETTYRVTLPYEDGLSPEANHYRAADALLDAWPHSHRLAIIGRGFDHTRDFWLTANRPEHPARCARDAWAVELTDTMGGEANYSWVTRETVTLPRGASRAAVIRVAKAAVGLTGVRCRTFDHGDGWELRPVGSCTVAFITPRY